MIFFKRTMNAARKILHLPLALLCYCAGFRILQLTHPERIGHLVGEVDCVLKEALLGRAPECKGLFLAPDDRVANRHIVRYLDRYLTVIHSPRLCRLLSTAATLYPFVRYRQDMSRYFSAIGETAEFNEIYSEWGDRPPLLELGQADRVRGEAALRVLGIPAGAPFVCFHSRDAGYSPADEHLHTYRNAGIETYLPAVEAMVERGLYCVRMGDPSMPGLQPLPKVVDYAHSPIRSDWMDVFLCASCEFFLGSSSGLYLVSTAFGRRSALANLAPMSTALSGGENQISIPKLLWLEREQRFLSFPETFSSPVADFRFSSLYRDAGVTPIDNEPDDIRALALEMLQQVRSPAEYSEEEEELQRRFRAFFRPGHYGFGSRARIGKTFLRKYAYLFDTAAKT